MLGLTPTLVVKASTPQTTSYLVFGQPTLRILNRNVLSRLIAAGIISVIPGQSNAQAPSGLAPPEYCSNKKFKHLSASYDPVIDSTTAFASYSFSTGWLNPIVHVFVLNVRHAGKASDSVLTPRLWLASPISEMIPPQPRINLLVDDSVRYSWASPLGVPSYEGNGARYGMGLVDLQWISFPVKADEFRRFATAKRATVLIQNRRYELKDKDFSAFAEILRWAECPADRTLFAPER